MIKSGKVPIGGGLLAATILVLWPAPIEAARDSGHHSANPKPSWYGESVGHYELGNTLVVDTIGMNDKTYIDNYLTPHTVRLHVVERFKLSDGGNTHPSATTAEDAPRFRPTEGSRVLEVSITVDDPGAFNTVWSGIQIYRMEFEGNWDETICAENNNVPHFSYENDAVPIPQATRSDFWIARQLPKPNQRVASWS